MQSNVIVLGRCNTNDGNTIVIIDGICLINNIVFQTNWILVNSDSRDTIYSWANRIASQFCRTLEIGYNFIG